MTQRVDSRRCLSAHPIDTSELGTSQAAGSALTCVDGGGGRDRSLPGREDHTARTDSKTANGDRIQAEHAGWDSSLKPAVSAGCPPREPATIKTDAVNASTRVNALVRPSVQAMQPGPVHTSGWLAAETGFREFRGMCLTFKC